MPEGRVLEMWRWPVKSMGGEQVRSFRVDARGVGGDRTHAVIHHHKGEWKPLTAREAPRLLAWHARYPFAPDAGLRPDDPPHAQVTGPDGEQLQLGRPAAAQRAGRGPRPPRAAAARPRRHPGPRAQRARHRRGTRAALAASSDRDRPAPLPHQRPPRAGRPPWEEHGWEGGTLGFAGGVVLRLCTPACAARSRRATRSRRRSGPSLLRHLDARHETLFGINARVLQAGRIARVRAWRRGRPPLQNRLASRR